jgi:hypothetical protein
MKKQKAEAERTFRKRFLSRLDERQNRLMDSYQATLLSNHVVGKYYVKKLLNDEGHYSNA